MDLKSEMFEKAIFIVKPSYERKSFANSELSKEANTIIENKIKDYAKKKKKLGIF